MIYTGENQSSGTVLNSSSVLYLCPHVLQDRRAEAPLRGRSIMFQEFITVNAHIYVFTSKPLFVSDNHSPSAVMKVSRGAGPEASRQSRTQALS